MAGFVFAMLGKNTLKQKLGPLWPLMAAPVRLVRIVRSSLLPAVRLLDPRRAAATFRWCRTWAARLYGRDAEERLRIAVDINPFWQPLTGVGCYLYQLLTHLENESSLAIDLYGPTIFLHPDDAPPEVEPPGGGSLRRVSIEVPPNLSLPQGWLVRGLRRIEPLLLAAQRHDVLFAPNFILPEKFRLARGALVLTIHDLAARHLPWTLEEETLAALERHLERNLRRASAVITPSAAVREELLEQEDLPSAAVTAIHHGPGHVRARAAGDPPPETPSPFALFVGTLEPRKNLDTLLAAWRRLVEKLSPAPALVLCGPWGWKSDELQVDVRRAQDEGWVRHFGYVPDEALAALYKRALLCACPSLYEGFGLPLVEAMAAGCPIVCSDIPVFREVATDAAIYVESGNAEEWARCLMEVVGDSGLREELAARGRRRCAAFSWRHAARRTAEVWRAAAG